LKRAEGGTTGFVPFGDVEFGYCNLVSGIAQSVRVSRGVYVQIGGNQKRDATLLTPRETGCARIAANPPKCAWRHSQGDVFMRGGEVNKPTG
jgi:hypothetical protein